MGRNWLNENKDYTKIEKYCDSWSTLPWERALYFV